MKGIVVWSLFSIVIGFQGASAQFPIKIPKITTEKPKVEQPKAETTPRPADSGQSPSTTSGPSGGDYVEPTAPDKPMFMKETLDVSAKTEARYWKVPNQNSNPSWFPMVEFKVFYSGGSKQRFNAEWFNADGTPWFTEQLEYGDPSGRGEAIIKSPYSNEELNKRATQAIGTYSFKIVNTKTSETVFQGKYKVKKIAYDPKIGTNGIFYVDHEWTMPIGYAGATADDWNTKEVHPAVMMWLKGEFENRDMESRLFYNGQEVASSDDGGSISTIQTRGGDCYLYRPTCEYKLWRFTWNKLWVLSQGYMRTKYPGGIYTIDKPGEYTAKIFYKGTQIREAKFSFDKNGGITLTPYSANLFPTISLIPVKVMGTAEKYTSATWAADQFYGNPLPGFIMP